MTGLAKGLCIDLMEVFAKAMNFNVRLVKRFDGKWPYKDPKTKTWGGMAAHLLNGDVDLD